MGVLQATPLKWDMGLLVGGTQGVMEHPLVPHQEQIPPCGIGL